MNRMCVRALVAVLSAAALGVPAVVAQPAAATPAAIPAAGPTAGPTAAQLESVIRGVDGLAASVPSSVAGWYVDQDTDSVVVSVVGAGDKASAEWVAKARKVSDAVRVETGVQRPSTLWNLIGGQAIYIGSSRCSLGVNARSGSARFVLTAGHCTAIGGPVNGIGGPIGSVAGSSFPGNDYGLIRVASSSAYSTALVDRYSSGSDVTVVGYAQPVVGMAVCRSGSTTGWRCGTITAINQTVNYGSGSVVYGLIRTNICAEPGDSGGPLVTNPGSGTTVRIVGLLSGGSGNCRTGGTTFYQPVVEALSMYGLSLYTG